MRGRRSDIRRLAVWTGKLLLAVVLLLLIADSVRDHSLLTLLADARPELLASALLLLPLNLWLQLRKWRILVQSRYPAITAADTRSSLLLGFAFGIVTPARLGEFGGRTAGFRSTAMRRSDRLALAGLTAADKFATMMITVAVGTAGLLLFAWLHPFMDPALLTVLLLPPAVLAAVLMRRLLRPAEPVSPAVSGAPFPSAPKSSGRLRDLLFAKTAGLRATLHGIDPDRRRRVLWYSALFYVTFLLQFYLLLSAFGPVHPLSALAGISTIMLLKTVIPPVTLGELGIREGASVFVLGHAGILSAAAFNAALLLFAINVLLPALAGLAVLLRLPPAESSPETAG